MSPDPDAPVATPSQTIGPFFHFALTTDPALGQVAAPGAGAERIRLRLRVLDGDGAPVTDAMIEIWQAAAGGGEPAGAAGLVAFGRLATGEDGSCEFETMRPGRVPDGRGGLQAAHVNVCLFARGLLRQVHTRIYFDADPALAEDAVLLIVPAARRHTLVARRDGAPDRWFFDIHLQGEGETVFFDL